MLRQIGQRNATVEHKRWRKAHWAIIAAAVFVPLLFSAPLDKSSFAVTADTMSYVRPGATFWRTGSYMSMQSRYPGPEMGRTPVYPLFVGLFASGDRVTVLPVILVQVLLRALLVILILTMPVTGTLWKLDWRVVAAALVAADLPSALLTLQVLTETLSSFLLVLSLWLYLKWQPSHLLPWLVCAGMIAGAAALTRPINIFFLPLLLILAAADIKRLSGLSRGTALAALIAATLLLPAAWMVRNYAWSGKLVFSTTGSQSLMYYRAAGIIAEQEGRSLEEVQRTMREREEALAYSQGLTEWEGAAQREAEAWKIIRSSPGLHLRLMAAGFLRALLGPGKELWGEWTTALRGSGTGWLAMLFTAVSLLHVVGLYLFTLVGLVRTDRQRIPWLGVWCLAVFLVLVIVSAGPESYSRYRLPVMPFLAMGGVLLCVSPRSHSTPTMEV